MVRIARKSTSTKKKPTAKTSKEKKASKASKPKRGGSKSKDVHKLAKMMRGIDLCMMTTQSAEGAFHTRPMSNNGEVEFGGDAWFFSGRDTPKVKELIKDDRISLA
jgi:hypothetical protein